MSPATDDDRRGPGPGPLTLPMILNIVHRGRRLVAYVTLAGVLLGLAYSLLTTPVYEATAQVRAGIVAYGGDGTPVREWALKDIVRWFRTNLYWQDLRQLADFAEDEAPPHIVAEFIPEGPQFMQGGDVITLSTRLADPLRAVAALDGAIAAFNHQVVADTVHSNFALTLGGARVRMARIRSDLELVAAEEERNALAIAAEERRYALLDAHEENLDMRMSRLDTSRAWRLRTIARTRAETAAARARLADARILLDRALAVEGGATTGSDGRVGQNDAVTEVLLQTASREQAARVGDLLMTVHGLSQAIYAGAARVDSLREDIARIDLDLTSLRLEKSADLPKQRADIAQRIRELEILRDRDLPYKRENFRNDLRAEQVQVDQLIPLERIGAITVSDKPVRPRRLRATAILTILAFAGGLLLAFVREYVRRNRADIFADGAG